ncbi:DUF3307 domain-containing protein [Desulfolucanica intricata]|uniref:DUF3307 domain-containing protein n=1 Tax=Desulfolucanica intricata TaxID=1285191 RepID=UPI00083607D9
MILNFLLLFCCHVLGDYYLQLNKFARYKRKNILILLGHAASWAVIISLGLFILNLFYWWKFFFLCFTHFLIDGLKIKFFRSGLSYLHPVNLVDQSLHLITIIITLTYL